MASMPSDPGSPGEPDFQSSVDAVNSAINQGYNYADVVAFHADNGMPQPPQPSLDAIMSGNTNDASQWSQPGGSNDPTRLDTNVRSQIDQVAESGMGVGAMASVEEGFAASAARLSNAYVEPAVGELGSGHFFSDLVANAPATSRAAQMGVETTTEGLTGRMTPVDLAMERVDQAMGTLPGKAAKWGAAAVGADLAGGPHRLGVKPAKDE